MTFIVKPVDGSQGNGIRLFQVTRESYRSGAYVDELNQLLQGVNLQRRDRDREREQKERDQINGLNPDGNAGRNNAAGERAGVRPSSRGGSSISPVRVGIKAAAGSSNKGSGSPEKGSSGSPDKGSGSPEKEKAPGAFALPKNAVPAAEETDEKDADKKRRDRDLKRATEHHLADLGGQSFVIQRYIAQPALLDSTFKWDARVGSGREVWTWSCDYLCTT